MEECWGASWLRLLAANMVTERRFMAPGNARHQRQDDIVGVPAQTIPRLSLMSWLKAR